MFLRLELWYYNRYAKMNAKRKSKEKTNPLFKAVDDFRRKTGYVK
jgi:hypothetical protein